MSCGGGSRRSPDYDEEPRERPSKKATESNDEALKILGVRLAKGEITKQEYEELRETLEGDGAVESRQEIHSHEAQEGDRQAGKRKRGSWLGDSFGRGGC